MCHYRIQNKVNLYIICMYMCSCIIKILVELNLLSIQYVVISNPKIMIDNTL